MADKVKLNAAKKRQQAKNKGSYAARAGAAPKVKRTRAKVLMSAITGRPLSEYQHTGVPRRRTAVGLPKAEVSFAFTYTCGCGYVLQTPAMLRKVNREVTCPECKETGKFSDGLGSTSPVIISPVPSNKGFWVSYLCECGHKVETTAMLRLVNRNACPGCKEVGKYAKVE